MGRVKLSPAILLALMLLILHPAGNAIAGGPGSPSDGQGGALEGHPWDDSADASKSNVVLTSNRTSGSFEGYHWGVRQLSVRRVSDTGAGLVQTLIRMMLNHKWTM